MRIRYYAKGTSSRIQTRKEILGLHGRNENNIMHDLYLKNQSWRGHWIAYAKDADEARKLVWAKISDNDWGVSITDLVCLKVGELVTHVRFVYNVQDTDDASD